LQNKLLPEEGFAKAIVAYNEAIAYDPNYALAYAGIADYYNWLGVFEILPAQECFQAANDAASKAIELDDKLSEAHAALGFAIVAGNLDWAQGEKSCRRALELNPNFEIALVHLGNAHFQIGRYREAIDLYEKYIEIAPSEFERARGYNCIARVYLAKKNTAAAAESAKRAMRQDNFSIWESVMIALERGDAATAEKLEEQLFSASRSTNRGGRISPRYGFYFRGYIVLKKGQAGAALENFKEAIRHLPPILRY